MEIENKKMVSYQYSAKQKGSAATIVSFYLDSRKNKKGAVLKKINICNEYDEIEVVPYGGQTLMIEISTGKQTVAARKATREDLIKFSTAFNLFVSKTPEFDNNKIWSYIGEKKPKKENKEKEDIKISEEDIKISEEAN